MAETQKSMVDVAYDYFSSNDGPVLFSDLWKHIVDTFELSESEAMKKLPLFYTNLSMDGRFTVLSENTWDLKSKHLYDETHRDVSEIYSYDEENSDDDDKDSDDDNGMIDEDFKADNDDEDLEIKEENDEESY